jgi:hypothetical protein
LQFPDDDEISHFQFINAYLVSKGATPVNLDHFRTLPGSQATGGNKSKKAHLKAIDFTAGFHFAFIEVGGTSLYPSLA